MDISYQSEFEPVQSIALFNQFASIETQRLSQSSDTRGIESASDIAAAASTTHHALASNERLE